jgi:hypothetical protein
MASRGWAYDKIIEYYYKGVRIVNISTVDASDVKMDTLNVQEHPESEQMQFPPDFHKQHRQN